MLEGEGLEPERACSLLGTCLAEVIDWLDTIISKTNVEGGVHANTPTTPPRSSIAQQPAKPAEDP